MWTVTWTATSGRTAEWHYANEAVAEETAARLRRGWRKDARVERLRG